MLVHFMRIAFMNYPNLYRTCRVTLLVIAASIVLGACAQTKVVDTWKTDKPVGTKPDKIAVVAVLPEALMRKAVEIDVANVLVGKGFKAIPSSNIRGMSGGIRGEIDVEVATGLLRDAEVDGIVVLFYAGGGQSEGYVRSDYWLEYLGTGSAYSWGRPYFAGTGMTSVYTVRQGPGYADFKTTAYVESSYYDMDTKEPLWRFVTFTKDVEHADAVDDISKKIASQMRSSGLK
jgi:hypothetical protein